MASDDHKDVGLRRGATVEELIFGTRDERAIDALIDRFCAEHLGASIAAIVLRETSVGVVRGVRLSDRRSVVVKIHQPRESPARLAAVRSIQQALWDAGFPCPEPLIEPAALGRGTATVETLLDAGHPRDCHNPDCRRLIAQALAWHLEITRDQRAPAALGGAWTVNVPGSLWPPTAHAPIFDFAATSAGAEWIDAIAAWAKPPATSTGPRLAGHSDWSGKHFRFAGDQITAVYDWDSLALRTEAELVSVAALTFPTRFDLPGVGRAAAPDEVRAFVDEYDRARDGRKMDRAPSVECGAGARSPRLETPIQRSRRAWR